MPDTTSISLPQLGLILLLTAFLIRHFFFRAPSPSASTGTAVPASSRHRTINVQHVEQIAAMFPQLERRAIAWDLQRNGGSIAATSERVLVGGGLDIPPPSFQPAFLIPRAASSRAGQSSPSPSEPAAHESLIKRYNLSSKISSPSTSTPTATDIDSSTTTTTTTSDITPTANGKAKSVWAPNKNERAALLARRREEMILGARRKMEERDRVVQGKAKVVVS